MTRSQQSGFSLVELLVAVTVTMIVSGAVYGLLASGQLFDACTTVPARRGPGTARFAPGKSRHRGW